MNSVCVLINRKIKIITEENKISNTSLCKNDDEEYYVLDFDLLFNIQISIYASDILFSKYVPGKIYPMFFSVILMRLLKYINVNYKIDMNEQYKSKICMGSKVINFRQIELEDIEILESCFNSLVYEEIEFIINGENISTDIIEKIISQFYSSHYLIDNLESGLESEFKNMIISLSDADFIEFVIDVMYLRLNYNDFRYRIDKCVSGILLEIYNLLSEFMCNNGDFDEDDYILFLLCLVEMSKLCSNIHFDKYVLKRFKKMNNEYKFIFISCIFTIRVLKDISFKYIETYNSRYERENISEIKDKIEEDDEIVKMVISIYIYYMNNYDLFMFRLRELGSVMSRLDRNINNKIIIFMDNGGFIYVKSENIQTKYYAKILSSMLRENK